MTGFQFSFVPRNMVFLILFIAYTGTCLADNKPSDPKSEVVVAISGCMKICESSKSAVTQILKMQGLRKVDIIFLKGCRTALGGIKEDLKKTIALLQQLHEGEKHANVQKNSELKVLIDNALSLLNACDSSNKGLEPEVAQIVKHEVSLRLKGSIEKAFGLGVYSNGL